MRKTCPTWESKQGNLTCQWRGWREQKNRLLDAKKLTRLEVGLWGRKGKRQRRGQRIPIYIKTASCPKPDDFYAWPHFLLAQGHRTRAHLCGRYDSHPWYWLIRWLWPTGTFWTPCREQQSRRMQVPLPLNSRGHSRAGGRWGMAEGGKRGVS